MAEIRVVAVLLIAYRPCPVYARAGSWSLKRGTICRIRERKCRCNHHGCGRARPAMSFRKGFSKLVATIKELGHAAHSGCC